MNRQQARTLALAWICDEMDHTVLCNDAPWRQDYSVQDSQRIERELEDVFDLLGRKRRRLEASATLKSP